MSLSALALNCTLKRSPDRSSCGLMLDHLAERFRERDVAVDHVRISDHHIPPGVSADEGDGDEWPQILEKVKAADIICIGTPIWFGVRGSVCQLVIERLDGTYNERNEAGQYPLYNKVGCVVVTGNEDGAHAAADTTLFNLTHLGCAIPPNADTYWVGDAGPGPSYIEAGGEHHAYTQRTTRWMAHNAVHLARILKANPIPAEGNTFDEETDHGPMHNG
jgi:multimeric flavodoxin WrbA